MSYTNSLLEEEIRKKEPSAIAWPWRLLVLSGIVFGITIFIFFGMKLGYEPILEKQLSGINQEIDQVTGAVNEEQKARFFEFYSQMKNVQEILARREYVSALFDLLEKNTIKSIMYDQANLDFKDGTFRIDGMANSYNDLLAQTEIYKANPLIKKSSFENARLDEKTGIVIFSLNLELAKKSVTEGKEIQE